MSFFMKILRSSTTGGATGGGKSKNPSLLQLLGRSTTGGGKSKNPSLLQLLGRSTTGGGNVAKSSLMNTNSFKLLGASTTGGTTVAESSLMNPNSYKLLGASTTGGTDVARSTFWSPNSFPWINRPYMWHSVFFYGKKYDNYFTKGCKNIRPNRKTLMLRKRGGRVYKCYVCDAEPIIYTLDGMKAHNAIHPNNEFECPNCLTRFPDLEWLNSHVTSRICYKELSNYYDEHGRRVDKKSKKW